MAVILPALIAILVVVVVPVTTAAIFLVIDTDV